MTGKEAKEIIDQLNIININLFDGYEKQAFYEMGKLVEKLLNIIRIDQVSFNPTVGKDEEL